MRILHVVPTYFPAVRYGGPIYSVHGLCKALVMLGHDVHVFTTNVDGPEDSDVVLEQAVDMDGVKVWYFPCHFGRRLYYSQPMKRALYDQVGGFDLVHMHSVFLWPTWISARIAEKLRVPYIISPRGMLVKELISRKSSWIKKLWIALIEKKNLRGASLIHVTADIEKRELLKFGFELPPITIVPNGIDLPELFENTALKEDVLSAIEEGDYMLFLGRINWKKGLDRLLKAMATVPQTRLIVAGNDEDNYTEELDQIVKKCELKDRVIFIKRFVAGADKQSLMKRAKFFVLPSYSENFANTVVEAMSFGTAVVVSRDVGAAEIVQQAQAGLVIDMEKLSDTLALMWLDESLCNLMGEKGAEWVRTHLLWKNVAENMSHEYRMVV